MEVRPHLSQHHRAERTPIETTTATVTLVEPMGESRNGEVEVRAAELLRENDHADLVRDRGHDVDIDWEGVTNLVSSTPDDELADSLANLVDRHERPHPSLLRVRLDVSGRFDFVAGQYRTMTYRDTPRPYSIASSPNADETARWRASTSPSRWHRTRTSPPDEGSTLASVRRTPRRPRRTHPVRGVRVAREDPARVTETNPRML